MKLQNHQIEQINHRFLSLLCHRLKSIELTYLYESFKDNQQVELFSGDNMIYLNFKNEVDLYNKLDEVLKCYLIINDFKDLVKLFK